jgi:hypothetical protein
MPFVGVLRVSSHVEKTTLSKGLENTALKNKTTDMKSTY